MMNILIYPEVQVVLLGVFLFVVDCYAPRISPRAMARLAAFGLVLVLLGGLLVVLPEDGWAGLYQVDGLAMFFKRFFLLATAFVVMMAGESAQELPMSRNEYVVLPFFPCAGMMLLASANDFITLFVALELVTISFYVLVASRRNHAASLEAGVKYLIIGALSTGFLVYGIAFLFGVVGSTSLTALESHLVEQPINAALLFAMLLILVGLCFKIAAVPFHIWAPDTYQGAPVPVTAFLAVASKAAGIIVLLRVFAFNGFANDGIQPYVTSLLAVLAAASVLLGNLAALPQRNIKRLLAYSGISHAGFMLMALSTLPSQRGVEAVLIYLTVYFLAAVLAFYVINLLGRQLGGDDLPDYNGLAERSPFLAFCLLVAFVSLAGIPPLAGFLGKLGVFAAVWESANYWLLVIGVFGAVAGLYYYLGIVRAMYWNEPKTRDEPVLVVSQDNKVILVLLLASLLLVGIWQTPLGGIIERTLPSAKHAHSFFVGKDTSCSF